MAEIISLAKVRKERERREVVEPEPEKLSSIMLREIAAQLGLPPLPRDTL